MFIQEKLSTAHEEMENFVGQHYKDEVERCVHFRLHIYVITLMSSEFSVSQLADVLHQAIEKEDKILHKLVLSGAKFNVNEVMLVCMQILTT